ncbi:hypothetical protein P5673_022699 [Acropora cervicornis]|uniref:DNA/RNA non-specific endonuclease domain-containing protein n=1 Tax=Acropora cervicornis TaxID=6130 RepID=A0AAD9Q6J8_ACRCE|nr:hypothetical protein P5673_022699 [Acropora cervicornis]
MTGRDLANSRESGNEERRTSSNSTQNSRQQRSRPQERNSKSNTENNRRVISSSRASKDNGRSTGITKQGTNALYAGSSAYKIDKGHLNPSHINSYDQNHQIATFKYTNAVPQFAGHNRISWREYEGKIANYVKTVCGPKGGNMHLITGTSNYLRSTTGQQLTGKIEYFPPNNPNAIMRPNSLWTPGCCVVSSTSAESIAVWGNNDNVDTETISLSPLDLEKLLVAEPTQSADLFPAYPLCRKMFHPL